MSSVTARVHIALNVFGWVGLTAVGTLLLLWPTVLRTHLSERPDSAARTALPLLVFGVMLSFLVLWVRAVMAGGRIRSRAASAPLAGLAAVPAATAGPRRTRSGIAAAAVGALVLAVTAGVSFDPVRTGVGAASVTVRHSGTVASGEVTELTVTMLDMRFSPSILTVPAGDRFELTVTNDDAAVHDLTLANGVTSGRLATGETGTVDAGIMSAGTAPGPAVRGKVGDTFTITLINEATTGHSLDFHAGALAPDGPMRTIAPGETLEYSFTATRSGIWLYHGSTMPMSLHIANGMFGAVVIDPAGLDPVDRKYLLVQSEFYLGPQGGIADSDKIAADTPDLVVFNGYANQYQEQPLRAKVGDRIRFWVLDAGPNLASSFHIAGGQFDTVYAEGDSLLRDGGSTGTGAGGSQTLGLAPAQGGFVELSFPEAGTYSFAMHAMTDAEHGAAGHIVVVP